MHIIDYKDICKTEWGDGKNSELKIFLRKQWYKHNLYYKGEKIAYCSELELIENLLTSKDKDNMIMAEVIFDTIVKKKLNEQTTKNASNNEAIEK